jgi:diguanylate cyclase (GGDEF)-like protein/PAS domain S-box-containing protein
VRLLPKSSEEKPQIPQILPIVLLVIFTNLIWYNNTMLDQKKFYRDLLDNLADGVYFTDLQDRIIYWNKGAERLSGYSQSDVLGKRCRDNILMHVDASGAALCTSACPMRITVQDGQSREADIFLHHKSGSRLPIHVRTTPLMDDTGKIIGGIEVFSDNTAKTQMAERLAQMEQLALLDTLTSLPNRRYLETQIYSHLEEFRRAGWTFGILFMDIDDFKRVNDRFGHEAGDRVLKMVAGTLAANSRFFDVVGRWGGEEFVAIIHNIDNQILEEIAERFRILVAQSTLTDLDSLSVTISIGGALTISGDNPESIVRRADENLYRAKKLGKNRVCLGDPIRNRYTSVPEPQEI